MQTYDGRDDLSRLRGDLDAARADLAAARQELAALRQTYNQNWHHLRDVAISLGSLAETVLVQMGELDEGQRAVRTRRMRRQ